MVSTSDKKTEISQEKYVSKALSSNSAEGLLYGKSFFTWMLIGLVLVILGMFLMSGGKQAPTEWNPNEIYSFRRTVLAPLVILIGLGIEIYAIFKK